MNINILEDKKGSLVFEIEGVTHGFCNLLKEEVAKDSDVKIATYRLDHPLVGVPRMKIEAGDAKAALKKALKSLKKEVEAFKKDAEKIK